MLTVNKYKNTLLEEFYLECDDLTIRRKKDGWRGKYLKGDKVEPFKMVIVDGQVYGGIHIPRTRSTIQYTHLLTILRGYSIPEGSVIDHQDGDTTNNDRNNLRITTQSLNCRNSKKRKNNTSGYTGICYNPRVNLYTVRKYFNGKREHRSAKTLDEAIAILSIMETDLIANHGYTQRHGK